MPSTIGMISLGCPKNQVDGERMLADLARAGFNISNELESCDAVIINTCGFIDAAKRESIDNILEMAQYKEAGMIKKIIVTGCMAERYREEVIKELPEIDALVGIGKNSDIVNIVKQALADEVVVAVSNKEDLPLDGERILTTPEYWAYLKIGEGCSNFCTYCAIPKIRGRFRSRTIESCVEEARALVESGVKEIILVAQDTTRYGEDLYGEPKLAELLRQLCKIEDLQWIRMLYCYPDRLNDEVIDVIAKEDKICKYLDLPLQHANGDILKRMNRHGNRQVLSDLIKKLRDRIPGICIRTTFITGFPGETDEQFEELAEFVKEMKFDRMGCFTYSPEENTPAATFENQIDEDVKVHRGELIMDAQYGIVIECNKQLIGKKFKVLVDGIDEETGLYIGRSYRETPEIDSAISFTSERPLLPGEFVEVEITDFNDYDLIGSVVS